MNGVRANIFKTRMIVVMFSFSFVLSDYIRVYILSNFNIQNPTVQNTNSVFLFCMFVLVVKLFFNRTYNNKIIYFWIPAFVLTLISVIFSYPTGSNFSMVLFFYLFPLLTIGIVLKKEELEITFSKCLTLLNITVCILLILGILDYITKGSIQLFLLQHGYFNKRITELIPMELSWGIYRYYSFFGHPLRNAQIFLTFFILNSIFNKYFYVKMNPLIISIITLVGVTLSNSKAGVVLALILVIFFNATHSKGKKWFYTCVSLVTLLLLLFSQFFNTTVIQRVTNSDDLSSGRSELVQNIIEGKIKSPNFFGYGIGESFKITANSNATSFEYPSIMFSYDLGIGATFFLYLIILIYPLYKLIMHQNYYLLLSLIILSLDVNSYNGLTNQGDFMIQLAFIVFLILNVNNYITEIYSKKFYKLSWEKKSNVNCV